MKGSFNEEQNARQFGGISPFAVAAHELKSPLSLLRQLALSLETDNFDESERQHVVEHMRLVSERALRLTTDLTKVERLDDGLFELEPVNPQQLCEEVAHDLAPLYKAYGREIIVTRRARPLLAVANRDLLRRVLLNFADNALHYSDETLPVELHAHSLADGELIRFSVRDYGPALSIDTWRALRETVARPQAIHARPGSSGLGLSIARQFAEAMNGTVGAIRHRDGATFYVDTYASRQLSFL